MELTTREIDTIILAIATAMNHENNEFTKLIYEALLEKLMLENNAEKNKQQMAEYSKQK